MGVDPASLICIFSSLPSMRPFESSMVSGFVGTPKLSEFARELSQDGGVDLASIICILSSLPSTRPFGSSLASVSSSESNPRIGDPLGSYRVSSQKQNHEDVVGAQSGRYRATMESNSECGRGPSRDATIICL
ncbi:hypothetical protein DVH24_026422 [Malus domestica]|uniref:Uncharacterized protein n=1 Tax=Malus domestica TaxID=3750 RepID=A0A498KIP1_MALDO|nr:hypothetical protein DVH24_026422 [Malus domestica]